MKNEKSLPKTLEAILDALGTITKRIDRLEKRMSKIEKEIEIIYFNLPRRVG